MCHRWTSAAIACLCFGLATACSGGVGDVGAGHDAGDGGAWLDASLPQDTGRDGAGGSAGELECLASVTGSGANELHQVEADADGNVIVAGRFREVIDFGSGPYRSNGDFDLFVAKYGADCALQWALTAGGDGADLARDPTIGPDGHILITGHISETVDIGGRTLDAGDDRALLLAKISPQGRVVWVHHEPTKGYISGSYATFDADGNIIAVAELRGNTSFAGGKAVNRSSVDRNLIAFAPDGDKLWQTDWYGDEPSFITGVDVASDGRILVVGEFRGELDFGDGPRRSLGGSDAYVAALTPTGALDWVKTFGGPGDDFAAGLDLTADDDLVVVGGFSGGVSFAGHKLRSQGYLDGFMLRVDPRGVVRWANAFGGPGYDRNVFVSVDDKDRAITASRFQKDVGWGGHTLQSSGVDDVAVSVVSPDGASVLWARQFGNELQDVWYQLDAPAEDTLVVAGGYQGSLKVFDRTLTDSSLETFFVARIKTAR